MTGHPIVQQFPPSKTLINGEDMQAVINTEYDSKVFDLSAYSMFFLDLQIEHTGSAAAGLATLKVILLADEDETVELQEIDLATSINTKADGHETMCFGRPVGATLQGTGTIGTSPGAIDLLRAGLGKCKFRVVVQEVHDGTSCTASLRLRAML